MGQEKLAILLTDGFEEVEALATVDVLRRGDIHVDMVTIKPELSVTGKHGIVVQAEKTWEEADMASYDGIILPGGPGYTDLRDDARVKEAVLSFYENGKLLAAICAAPTILGAYGILKGRKATCFAGMEAGLTGAQVFSDPVVEDGQIITSRGVGTAIDFGLAILARFIGTDAAEKTAQSFMYTHYHKK